MILVWPLSRPSLHLLGAAVFSYPPLIVWLLTEAVGWTAVESSELEKSGNFPECVAHLEKETTKLSHTLTPEHRG